MAPRKPVTPENSEPLKGQGRPRTRAGRFTARPETAERDAEAVRLRVSGQSLRQIADELGFASCGAVTNAIKRAFARTSDGVVRDYQQDREIQAARLDTVISAAYEAMNTFVPMVDSRGQVVIDPQTEKPYRDFSVVLGAIDRVVKIEARRSSLQRLDETKQPEEVDASAVDAEFENLVARLEPGAEGTTPS